MNPETHKHTSVCRYADKLEWFRKQKTGIQLGVLSWAPSEKRQQEVRKGLEPVFDYFIQIDFSESKKNVRHRSKDAIYKRGKAQFCLDRCDAFIIDNDEGICDEAETLGLKVCRVNSWFEGTGKPKDRHRGHTSFNSFAEALNQLHLDHFKGELDKSYDKLARRYSDYPVYTKPTSCGFSAEEISQEIAGF